MVANPVLFRHSKEIEGAAQAIFVWYPKQRIDLKMMHDGNDVLTDNKLVITRDFFKKIKICMFLYTK